jgi:aerobic C4-dicarboxylate transport protein
VRGSRLWSNLYVQVLTGIAAGIALALWSPEKAAAMRPLGDGFIKLVKMMIAPVVFTTVAVGIAQMGAVRDVGRIGLKALVYFEAASTVALVIGLVVVNVLQPGVGIAFDPQTMEVRSIASYTTTSQQLSAVDFLLHVIPDTVIDALAKGDILQVLLVSVLFGLALLVMGADAQSLVGILTVLSHALFAVIAMIMRLAPIGAFGAMAFTVGKYGLVSLVSLGKLMAGVYLTCGFFVFVVLGGVAAAAGFSLPKLLRYVSEEILIVLGTSSSESALPRVMQKLERLGCSKAVVGLVVPTGYSFNLDGTSIYMTMAALFVAQASGVHLSLARQLGILAILLLTSKGAAAVTGSGFVTLAATLAAFPTIPIAGLTLLVGVDRFMSEARAVTNLIGNAVATIVVAKWDGALDLERARQVLDGRIDPQASAVGERAIFGSQADPLVR